MRVILIKTLSTLFTNFTENFKKFKRKATTTETKNRKNRIMKNVNQRYDKYFDRYKKNYASEKVKGEEKRWRDYKQFEIIDIMEIKNQNQLKKKRRRQKNLMKYKIHYGLN